MSLNNRKQIFLIALLIPALIALYFAYYFLFSPVTVVNSNVEKDVITLEFDKGFKDVISNVQIVSDPSASWQIENLSAKKVSLTPKSPLEESTLYKVGIFGKRVNPFELSFTTKAVEFGVGAPEAQKAFETYEKAFPILKFLPYKAEKYTIMQSQKDEYFVIVFGLYKDELEAIKKEVFAWFLSKGVDPTKVKIDFVE